MMHLCTSICSKKTRISLITLTIMSQIKKFKWLNQFLFIFYLISEVSHVQINDIDIC